MRKHIEVKTIEYKGIQVTVRIDYDAGTASLVEQADSQGFPAKQWIFKGRTVEYMQGWLDILEAMAVAVKQCKKDLEENAEENEEIKMALLLHCMKPNGECTYPDRNHSKHVKG